MEGQPPEFAVDLDQQTKVGRKERKQHQAAMWQVVQPVGDSVAALVRMGWVEGPQTHHRAAVDTAVVVVVLAGFEIAEPEAAGLEETFEPVEPAEPGMQDVAASVRIVA